MAPTICILAAGQGTRMGDVGKYLNKALFPIGGKAAISRILERFPRESLFVIALGYLGEQVKTYVEFAHPNLNITFVQVDKYVGEGSGPGYSLLCCREHLTKPFFFIACDTLINDEINFSSEHDWVGVARVEPNQMKNYCNFQLDGKKVINVLDKQVPEEEGYVVFTGVCFIKNLEIFWSGILSGDVVSGELQISSGIKALLERHPVMAETISWFDIGTEEKYREVLTQYEDFDFSKVGEAIYFQDNKVIKFFSDRKVVENRVLRAGQNPSVFPEICDVGSQFYSYEFVRGDTMYKINNQFIFKELLNFLNTNLWKSQKIDHDEVVNACREFYREKSFNRVEVYQKKYPHDWDVGLINGKSIPSLEELFDLIPWEEQLFNGDPHFIHGDLQFDNIIFDPATTKFRLLDWRQDFSGHLNFGDIYYDFSKLLGGILMNYDYIKAGLFSYSSDAKGVSFDYARRIQAESLRDVLEGFVTDSGWSFDKVTLIVSLIYLNMAPLHSYPFDKLLFAQGKQLLAEYLLN